LITRNKKARNKTTLFTLSRQTGLTDRIYLIFFQCVFTALIFDAKATRRLTWRLPILAIPTRGANPIKPWKRLKKFQKDSSGLVYYQALSTEGRKWLLSCLGKLKFWVRVSPELKMTGFLTQNIAAVKRKMH
jgi:hypothetical protein